MTTVTVGGTGAGNTQQGGGPGGLDLGPAPLLGWLPDETLFSICSRQHAFWGHAHARTTASALFGAPRGGTQHDLPGYLDRFAETTGGLLGTGRFVAEQRTLLRYYRQFLSEKELADAVAAMRSTSVAHLKYRLGLLTSRFRANHPLKGCRQCLKDDVEELGWPYWHLEHQYPGVWICLKHEELLQECIVKSTGVERFQWVLPSQRALAGRNEKLPDRAVRRLKSLAATIVQSIRIEGPPGTLSADCLRTALLRAVRGRNWAAESGQLRLREMAAHFAEYCADLRHVQELRGLPQSLDDAMVQVGRLMRPMRTGTHPLRYLTLVDWIYPSFAAFQEDLGAVLEATPFGPSVNANIIDAPAGPGQELRRSTISLLRSGMAVTAVAKQVGVDAATAMAWGAQEGIAVLRRPSVLKGDVRRRLLKALEEGGDKRTLAARYGISESSVNRMLRTEVDLHRKWIAARERLARSKARKRWLTAVKAYRGQGIKLARAAEPSAYAWLYRNDRAWLDKNLPDRLPPRASERRSVSWDSRDRDLKAQVQVAIHDVANGDPQRKVRLWEIYQRVPELKAKLSRLDRLPLTKKTLDKAVSRPRRMR